MFLWRDIGIPSKGQALRFFQVRRGFSTLRQVRRKHCQKKKLGTTSEELFNGYDTGATKKQIVEQQIIHAWK